MQIILLLCVGLLLFANNQFCVGLHEITRKGMVGDFISRFVLKIFGEHWSKPITECVTCMASVWSIPFFIYSGLSWYLWPCYALILAGINATYTNQFYGERERDSSDD